MLKYPGWFKGLLSLLLLAAACAPVTAVWGAGNAPIYLPRIQKSTQTLCRFGITTRIDIPGYLDKGNLTLLRSGALIDWNNERPASLSGDVRYVHIIGTGVNFNPNTTVQNVTALVKQYPGAIWQVGNEPDRVEYQDEATPQEYGLQYYQIARAIRDNDPTAKIAFGSIVQPTPIRRVYLDRAWDELVIQAGGSAQASALVDIWSIHAFLLNEKGTWGAGIPTGLIGNEAPLFEINLTSPNLDQEVYKTHDVNLLMGFIRDFRAWMAAKGERAKPLWISEYGSAFPPIDKPAIPPDPAVDYYNVSDAETAAYMVASFDFFRSATDAATGMPGDNNLLVQRWFWYTLNDHRWKFGGVLFDPDNNNQITEVGQAYLNYTAPLTADFSCSP